MSIANGIIFFGASKFVIPILEKLYKRHKIELVVTTEKSLTDSVPSFCKEFKIPFISIDSLKDKTVSEKLKSHNCKTAVLAYFGLIVPQEILNIFSYGIINIHPSLLPKYRGPTPGTSAILDNVTTTGVSIMILDNKVDHGPIIAQEKYSITKNETSESLYLNLFTLGVNILEKILPDYLNGKIKPIKQDDERATYTPKVTRESGYIDIAESIELMGKSRDEIERSARAYYPWPGVWTIGKIKNKESRIKILPGTNTSTFMLQVEGKKPMTIKDFINGYKEGKEIVGKLKII